MVSDSISLIVMVMTSDNKCSFMVKGSTASTAKFKLSAEVLMAFNSRLKVCMGKILVSLKIAPFNGLESQPPGVPLQVTVRTGAAQAVRGANSKQQTENSKY